MSQKLVILIAVLLCAAIIITKTGSKNKKKQTQNPDEGPLGRFFNFLGMKKEHTSSKKILKHAPITVT